MMMFELGLVADVSHHSFLVVWLMVLKWSSSSCFWIYVAWFPKKIDLARFSIFAFLRLASRKINDVDELSMIDG